MGNGKQPESRLLSTYRRAHRSVRRFTVLSIVPLLLCCANDGASGRPEVPTVDTQGVVAEEAADSPRVDDRAPALDSSDTTDVPGADTLLETNDIRLRSITDIVGEFRAMSVASNYCREDAECVYQRTGGPFGCGVPVNAEETVGLEALVTGLKEEMSLPDSQGRFVSITVDCVDKAYPTVCENDKCKVFFEDEGLHGGFFADSFPPVVTGVESVNHQFSATQGDLPSAAASSDELLPVGVLTQEDGRSIHIEFSEPMAVSDETNAIVVWSQTNKVYETGFELRLGVDNKSATIVFDTPFVTQNILTERHYFSVYLRMTSWNDMQGNSIRDASSIGAFSTVVENSPAGTERDGVVSTVSDISYDWTAHGSADDYLGLNLCFGCE